jgi:hypothetical protein
VTNKSPRSLGRQVVNHAFFQSKDVAPDRHEQVAFGKLLQKFMQGAGALHQPKRDAEFSSDGTNSLTEPLETSPGFAASARAGAVSFDVGFSGQKSEGAHGAIVVLRESVGRPTSVTLNEAWCFVPRWDHDKLA